MLDVYSTLGDTKLVYYTYIIVTNNTMLWSLKYNVCESYSMTHTW